MKNRSINKCLEKWHLNSNSPRHPGIPVDMRTACPGASLNVLGLRTNREAPGVRGIRENLVSYSHDVLAVTFLKCAHNPGINDSLKPSSPKDEEC